MVSAIENPHISVALPIRNGMPHLLTAMAGLMNQTYKNFTVVVQDCLSTDGSLEFLRSLHTHFEIDIVSKKDESLAQGYNWAYQRCKGDLVVTAAADECFDHDAFEKYVRWHQARPDAAFIYGGSRITDCNGGVTAVFEPKEFDLLDFVRQEMSPTQAGVYNRTLLGSDLMFDETLKVCPDFDLVVRMALKYGQERLVRVSDVTMSARGDEASQSFRPELFKSFAINKAKVVRRLFDGIYADQFREYLLRDLSFNIYYRAALIAQSITGDTKSFQELAAAADQQFPSQIKSQIFVKMSPHFVWNSSHNNLVYREHVPPDVPPDWCDTAFRAYHEDMYCLTEWRKAGARLRFSGAGMRVKTASEPWQYSAGVNLDFSEVDLEKQYCWLRVTAEKTVGDAQVMLLDSKLDKILEERRLPEGPAKAEIIFEVTQTGDLSLIVRAGNSKEGGETTLLDIELLTVPINEARERPKRQRSVRPIRPRTPPDFARVTQKIGPTQIVCSDQWRDAGAEVALVDQGARVKTSTQPWHYGAAANLDLKDVDFDNEFCWVHARFRDSVGQILVGLFDPEKNTFQKEVLLSADEGAEDLIFYIPAQRYSMLLLRNAETEGGGETTFCEARVLTVAHAGATSWVPENDKGDNRAVAK